MPLLCRIALVALASLLFVSCSRSTSGTVTTQDGKTIQFKSLTLYQYGLFTDSSSGTFTLEIPTGALEVPRNLKGIRQFEIVRKGYTIDELNEKLAEFRSKKQEIYHESLGNYTNTDQQRKTLAQTGKEKTQKLEEEKKNLLSAPAYRFRITYENGNVIDGNMTDFQAGWGHIIGRTENGEMKIQLDKIISIKLN